MPLKLLITIFVFLFSFAFIANGQVVDSAKQMQEPIYSDTAVISKTGNDYVDNDLPPALFFLFFGLATLVLAFICIGIGVAIVIIGVLIIFGLHKKSFSLGFKMFLLLSLSIVGIGIRITGSYLLNKVFNFRLAHTSVISVGAVSGLIGGILLGHLVYVMMKKLTIYFKQRLHLA